MKIRALIVDDEELARRRIRELLAGVDDVEVLGECSDGEEALRRIQALRPELVFLDVQMPEMTGFDVLQSLEPEQSPVVVFATAYDEYAMRAFDAHAVGYLLKPLDRSRFEASLEQARAVVNHRADRGVGERMRALLATLGQPEARYPDRVSVRLGQRIEFVRTSEIDWVSAESNYVRLHVGKRTHLIRESLNRFAERLDPTDFLRIHRSVVVNTERIREVQSVGRGSYMVILRDGTKLTSGANFRDGIEALIDGSL